MAPVFLSSRLCKANKVEGQPRVDALLTNLGPHREVLAELILINTARVQSFPQGVLPARFDLLEMAQPELDARS